MKRNRSLYDSGHKEYKNGDRLPNGSIKLNNMVVDDEYYFRVVTVTAEVERILIPAIQKVGEEEDGKPTISVKDMYKIIQEVHPEYEDIYILQSLYQLMPPFCLSTSLRVQYNPSYVNILDI